MNLRKFAKKIRKKYQSRIAGSDSAQTAYQTLQRGVRRYEEKQTLLSNRELKLVQASQNLLVLSAPERKLIETSEKMLSQRSRSSRRLVFISLALLILAASILILWPLSSGETSGLSTPLTVANDPTDEARIIPAEKLNRSPSMQTSNLPVKRERRRQLQQKTTTASPPAEKKPLKATKEFKKSNFFGISEALSGISSPLAGLPEPKAKEMPQPKPEKIEEAPEEAVPATEPAKPAETTEMAERAEAGEPAEKSESKTISQPQERRFTYRETINTSYGKVMIVQEQGKWGLTDISGKYLLEPEYDHIRAFHTQRGLFLIERSGKRGIAQAQGDIILYPFFEHIKSYHLRESLLVVSNNGKFGVYDEKEKEFAIGLEFQDICCLADGLFGVQLTGGKWGFIDRKGNMIIPAIYDALESPFEEGRALVKKAGRKYYIDKAGNVFPYKGES